MKMIARKKKTRLIVKNGDENIVLPVAAVAMLYIKERTVIVVRDDSKGYHFHKSLAEIEQELDKSTFFRANRRTIININFIKSFSVCECNKLKVEMNVHAPDAEIIVSQQTAPHFKTWICES